VRRLRHLILGLAAGATLSLLTISPPVAPLIARATASASKDAGTTYDRLELFGKVFDAVREDYVEKRDSTKLIQSALKGMMGSLDPHSNYMDAQAFQEMQVETTGEFGGVGMEVTTENNAWRPSEPDAAVYEPYPCPGGRSFLYGINFSFYPRGVFDERGVRRRVQGPA
jgi:carboxyl-terminal processing protease